MSETYLRVYMMDAFRLRELPAFGWTGIGIINVTVMVFIEFVIGKRLDIFRPQRVAHLILSDEPFMPRNYV